MGVCVCVGGGGELGSGVGEEGESGAGFFLAWAGKSPEPKPWQRQQAVIKAFHSAVVLEEEERRVRASTVSLIYMPRGSCSRRRLSSPLLCPLAVRVTQIESR